MGGKYNEVEIENEASVDTKATETQCNRPVTKKGNDGETTGSEAGNAERRSASRGYVPSRMSENDARHRVLR